MKAEMEIIQVEPYQSLAKIYDEVMAHVDYDNWAQFIYNILSDNGLKLPHADYHPRLFDCGCGSGNFAIRYALLGFSVVGSDASQEMIQIARYKAELLENKPEFLVKSFQEIDYQEEFEVVLCLYDSINYISNEPDILMFLKKIKRALIPGGFFMFDICTEKNSRLNFSNRKEKHAGPDFETTREMRFVKSEMIQENRFQTEFKDDPGKIYIETHRQKIYKLSTIKKLIGASGLELLETSNEFTRNPAKSNSLRIHFLCKKQSLKRVKC